MAQVQALSNHASRLCTRSMSTLGDPFLTTAVSQSPIKPNPGKRALLTNALRAAKLWETGGRGSRGSCRCSDADATQAASSKRRMHI